MRRWPVADRRRAARLVVPAAVLAALLAGCTAGDAEPGRSEVTTSTADPSVSGGESGESPAEGDGVEGPDEGAEGAVAPEPGDMLPTAEPVPLEDEADFGTGVTSSLDGVEAIQAEAHGPGEIAGPALAFEIRLVNSSDEDVDLGAVTVNLADDAGDPGLPMLGPPSQPFQGALGAGEEATATYVFAVDEGSRSVVSLEVSYSTQAPVVVFRGSPTDV